MSSFVSGFTIETTVQRAGRATGNTTAAIVDSDGTVRVTATGMHVAISDTTLFGASLDNSAITTPRFADSLAGDFPIGRVGHDRPAFQGAVEVRYPPGEDDGPGATTVWMRTVPLLTDEEPSPFQRICPLADCGNAVRYLDV